MTEENKCFFLYLTIAFGIWWLGIITITTNRVFFDTIIGPMSLSNPVVIFFTYLPTIAGLLVYYRVGGAFCLKEILFKFLPRKNDLILFPILFLGIVFFVVYLRFGSLFFDIGVPTLTYSISEMVKIAVFNLFKETALIGGCIGWVGFLLPFLQKKLKNSTLSGLLTGFLFAFWVIPMPLLLGAKPDISYILYTVQLMLFFVFTSYLFNYTKGTITFYLFTFWLVSTGAHIQMYYFNKGVQAMEIAFFILASIVAYWLFSKTKRQIELQVFPDYIQQRFLQNYDKKESLV